MNKNDDHLVLTDKAGWMRDPATGAVLSVDRRGLADHRARMIKVKATQAKLANINTLEDRIKSLESLVTELITNKDE